MLAVQRNGAALLAQLLRAGSVSLTITATIAARTENRTPLQYMREGQGGYSNPSAPR